MVTCAVPTVIQLILTSLYCTYLSIQKNIEDGRDYSKNPIIFIFTHTEVHKMLETYFNGHSAAHDGPAHKFLGEFLHPWTCIRFQY